MTSTAKDIPQRLAQQLRNELLTIIETSTPGRLDRERWDASVQSIEAVAEILDGMEALPREGQG